MENLLGDEESEQIPDGFVCCVCLDLLFKPIVLACGHVACFWCVHKSMDGLRESHCPICRCAYHHFPTVCQMFHFLLLKMYPITYKRREIQILEEEKNMGFFSPTMDDNVCASCTNELVHLANGGKFSATSSGDNLPSDPFSTRQEACANVKQLEPLPGLPEFGQAHPKEISNGSLKTFMTASVEGNKSCHRCSKATPEQVSIADLLCVACNQLLFRPVVLNCGHVYCETCIIIPEEDKLRCQVCQCPQPRGFAKVCLELDQFLEQQFPAEYMLRRCSGQVKQANGQQKSPTTCSAQAAKQGADFSFPSDNNLLPWWGDHDSKFHIGVGCDACGMCPIIGDRYKCQDCKEAIGFDVCGDCYNTRSKLPGRFNQQHTPEHKFEIVKTNSIRHIMLRIWRVGQLEDGSSSPALPDDENIIDLDNLIPHSSSQDHTENVENGLAVVFSPTVDEGESDDEPM